MEGEGEGKCNCTDAFGVGLLGVYVWQLESTLSAAVDTIWELTPLCEDRWCVNDLLDDDDSLGLKRQVVHQPASVTTANRTASAVPTPRRTTFTSLSAHLCLSARYCACFGAPYRR